jgi:transposase
MIFVGDDWAEDHHDVYLMDEGGKRLTSRRLPEGLVGVRQLHELIASHVEDPDQVIIGIETDRGLWVGALTAAGYAHLLERLKVETDTPVYVPGFERTLEQPLAAELVVLPTARLVITEGNYLLVDDPQWTRARAAIDTVWFVAGEDGPRIRRLVARHIHFGKTSDEARAWVTTTDQRNSELVSTTLGKADRVIVNDAAGWMLTR